MACSDCPGKVYTHYTGAHLNANIEKLNVEHPLMVIGESPTAIEAARGNFMTGNGGQVLKETFQKVGLPYTNDQVYYTTALKCAFPKKKGQKLPPSAPVNCRDYLLNEIRAIEPKLILVCGATALTTLTGNAKIKITELYGTVQEYDFLPGIKVLPIMNPGVLIHKPGDYKPFLTMIQLAATIFKGGDMIDSGETKYIVCDTTDKCNRLYAEMISLNKEGKLPYAGVDIETTGLDYRIVEFCILGICFKKGLTYIIPREMRHVVHNFLEGVPWKLIWQHGKYDKKVLWKRQLATVNIDEDTMYEHYVLDETSAHDLGYLSKVYLNAAPYKYKMNQEFKAVSLETYDSYFDALCERAAVDCNYTFQLHERFQEILHEEDNKPLLKLYNEILIPAANYLARVEQNGMLINPTYLNNLDEKYTVLLEQIMHQVEELASPWWDPRKYQEDTGAKSASAKFNPASPKQMAWMVFDRFKLKPRIKKGRSTAKEVLDSIEDAPELIAKVREYRTVQKEHSTYVIGLLNAQDDDGRVRSTFSLHITATGRLSSKEPNVQNQPSANGVGNIRKAFIAPRGTVLAEIDYSGAELRWMAFLSKCPVLTEVFVNGRNLHDETAKALFGQNYSKAEKLRAKAVNFGIPYGREAKSLAEEFNIPQWDAEKMLNDWLNKYPGARDYLAWCAKQVELGNYLETPYGRRRRFGLVTKQSLHALQNEARNFPIQSASSDTMLISSMRLEDELLRDYNTRIINLVHDSMLLEIPAEYQTIKEVARRCNEVMINLPVELFNCPVPFKTDFEVGVNWGDIGGTVFGYSDERTVADCIYLEKEDKSLNFYDWYNDAMKREVR